MRKKARIACSCTGHRHPLKRKKDLARFLRISASSMPTVIMSSSSHTFTHTCGPSLPLLIAAGVGAYTLLRYAVSAAKSLRDRALCERDWARHQGEWVVVTGASEAVGRDVALELGRRGLSIVAVGHNTRRLQALAADIAALDSGAHARVVVCAAQPASAAQCIVSDAQHAGVYRKDILSAMSGEDAQCDNCGAVHAAPAGDCYRANGVRCCRHMHTDIASSCSSLPQYCSSQQPATTRNAAPSRHSRVHGPLDPCA
eukprot:Opistho-2@13979